MKRQSSESNVKLEHCRVVMEFEQSSNGKEWNEFMSEPKKALIFDIDGTLWDATEQLCEVWNTVIRSLSIERRLTVGEVRSIMGKTIEKTSETFFPDFPKEQGACHHEEMRRGANRLSCPSRGKALRRRFRNAPQTVSHARPLHSE